MAADPEKPKRPPSAWQLFVAAQRKKDGATGKIDFKGYGELYAAMTDEQKQPFVDGAAAEKVAHATATAEYTSSGKAAAWLATHPPVAKVTAKSKKAAAAATKAPKDKNAPKKPLSSYMIFAAAMRLKPEYQVKKGERTVGEVGKSLGAAWKALATETTSAMDVDGADGAAAATVTGQHEWIAKAAEAKATYAAALTGEMHAIITHCPR